MRAPGVERSYPQLMRVDAERLLDLLPDMVVMADADGVLGYVNAAVERTLGWKPHEIIGRSVFEFVHPDEQAEAVDTVATQIERADDTTERRQAELIRRDGTFCKVELHTSFASGDGTLLVVLRDLAERTEIQRQAHRNEEQLRALTENVPDALGRFDCEGQLVFATRRFKEVVDAHDDVLALWAGHATEALTRGELGEVEHTLSETGEWIAARFVPERGMDGEVTHVLVIASDATLRKQNEMRLVREATHDPLTGLVNRHRFRELAERSLRRAAGNDEHDHDGHAHDGHRGADGMDALHPVALVFIDLDDFKGVNDRHGHIAGDAVLATVGRRLADLVRPQDVVARYGGDEFLMLCDGLTDEAAAVVAQRIAVALAAPMELANGQVLSISASVGVAASVADHGQFEALLEAADAAMYRSKASPASPASPDRRP